MLTELKKREITTKTNALYEIILETIQKKTLSQEDEDRLAILAQAILVFRKEINELFRDSTPDEEFFLTQVELFINTFYQNIQKKINPDAVSSPLALEKFIIPNLSNVRLKEGYGEIAMYVNPRAELTHSGACLIADYYNQKYFRDDRKIVIATSFEDLQEKMHQALHGHDKDLRIGFTVTLNRYDLEKTTPHPTPMILERKEGMIHLYIADSVTQVTNRSIAEKLAVFCAEESIIPVLSKIVRQEDNGSCRSEALVYLKNALQLPGTISEHVAIENKSPYFEFTDCADMLKTAQSTRKLSSIPQTESARLHSTKTHRFFAEKLEPYRRPCLYLLPEAGMKSLGFPDIDFFSERTYLEHKAHHHLRIIQNIIQEPGITPEKIEEIKQRSVSLPVVEDTGVVVKPRT